ncbi:hypothetical protein NIES2104_32360 [Leptolyngbya sp. NIES-2104]|nr:hypothetical protein NIES2104_32360 [Leptolyngbya sp. NIES-2104]
MLEPNGWKVRKNCEHWSNLAQVILRVVVEVAIKNEGVLYF